MNIWPILFVNNFYFLSISVGAIFFLALQNVTGAQWFIPIKRIPLAIGQFLWVSAIIMIIIFVAHPFPSPREGLLSPPANWRGGLGGAGIYQSFPFFIIRTIIYLSLWLWLFWRLAHPRPLPKGGELEIPPFGGIRRATSIAFIIIFVFTFVFASWDWVMSINANWYSTIFGLYCLSGAFISAICVIALFVVYLNEKKPILNPSQREGLFCFPLPLGKGAGDGLLFNLAGYLFAFSIFWTYLWFSQYLIIWYTDIPEETQFYRNQLEHYKVFFIAMLFCNFFFPLILLMSRRAKQNVFFITITSVIIAVGQWLNIYLMIIPNISKTMSISEIFAWSGISICFIGLFLFVVSSSLKTMTPIFYDEGK